MKYLILIGAGLRRRPLRSAIFVAYYQDPVNGVSAAAMNVREFLEIVPEINVPEDQLPLRARPCGPLTLASTCRGSALRSNPGGSR